MNSLQLERCLVIIPTYNEIENIHTIIDAVLSQSEHFSVLIVDDNSPDGTGEIVKSMKDKNPRVHLIQREDKLGLGTAYIAGFRYGLSHGFDFIFEMDGASLYVRSVTWMPVHDPTAGFICYKNHVLASLDLDKIKFIGYTFQIEMKFYSWIKGFTLKEVPITFIDREKGKSKMHANIVSEAIKGVLKMRWRKFNGYYD